MGAGASAEVARRDVTEVCHNIGSKPMDASDIKDLDQAKAEIRNLRRMAKKFNDMMIQDEMKLKGAGGGKQKRAAVLDRGEELQNSQSYVPKVVEKADATKTLILNVVMSNILFSSYSKEEHDAIVDAFESKKVSAGEYVIEQGSSGDYFYVVESGKLDIYVKSGGQETKVGNPLTSGSAFGELALMYNTPRNASIKAVEDCSLWQIDRSCYRGIVTYYKYIRNKQYMDFLRQVSIKDQQLGKFMSDTELEKMVIALERETFKAGDTIIREGNTGDHFYIIAEGTVGVYKLDAGSGENEQLSSLKEGSYFGEKALLSEDKRKASCIAMTKTVCLSLGREDFVDMMGSIDDLMDKDKRLAAAKEKSDAEAQLAAENEPVGYELKNTLGDFDIKNTLGCGAFGRVKLCHLPETNSYYALKCQAKRSIVESGLQEHVLNEMRIMRKLNHPFIAKLFLALQDNQYIYFVLELLQGGELFTYLRNKGKLSEVAARFYSATVVYAFSTLHAKKIAYRDLKPENLVMDTNGYVKLVDFGLAKQILSGKTWTLCGTPDYLAPEIILNEGHDHAVDYWALGVLIFEMVVGAPPFFADDPMEVYEKILSGNPSMPPNFTRNLSDLVKKLLRSQQGKRLGNTRGGPAAVVKHKWFSSFDWIAIEEGTMKAPHVPIINSKDDVANFDKFDEGETPKESDWSPDLNL